MSALGPQDDPQLMRNSSPENEERIPSVVYGWAAEFAVAGASIAMAALIYFVRPEYYRLSAAVMLALINWYVIRTVIDYATGSPMVLFLVRIQSAERRVARSLIVTVVTFTLTVFYVAMLVRWFDPA